MDIEMIGQMKPFNDLAVGTIFLRGDIGIRVSLGGDSGVLLLDQKPAALIVNGYQFVNKSVLILEKAAIQTARDRAKWNFGLSLGPQTGFVVISGNSLLLRADHPSGHVDVDLLTGLGKHAVANENVAWSEAWRVVINAGAASETVLLQSAAWSY
ncbi:hypothetical protein [Bradyrhizobium sp. SZCCHNS2096]|uniref:hypothetical protein n=1 Tax=Bradyrhizobium sp. SZCCHNS2096 TaxID=3057309 RepID=UPI00291637D0|nr:hypothetical protein [Bradyrhizobium sp. SZCCHNS2096]